MSQTNPDGAGCLWLIMLLILWLGPCASIKSLQALRSDLNDTRARVQRLEERIDRGEELWHEDDADGLDELVTGDDEADRARYAGVWRLVERLKEKAESGKRKAERNQLSAFRFPL